MSTQDEPPVAESLCASVSSLYRKPFQTTQILLGELLKSHQQISLDYVPLETFAKEQSCRVIDDIMKKLNNLTMTTEDVKDHISNIVASFKLYHKQLSVEGAAMAMKCLRSFIFTIAELCNIFELVNSQELTDWFMCASVSERTLRAMRPKPAFPAQDFVPMVGEFEILRTLGKGGFGAVLDAVHTPTKTRVCIKLIRLDRMQKISFAALDKILASVTEHEKLVKYFCSFLTTEAYMTIMESVQGVDVIKFIELEGELPEEYSVKIIHQMVKAISHLHAHGFIHRDIKPLNTLVLPGGHIKVIDFDTCKICMAHFMDVRPLQTYFALTAAEFSDQDYAGTLTFLPPEVILRRSYGRALDWWAIGVTAYRLLVGRLPFRSKDRQKLKLLIVKEELSVPTTLKDSAQEFISHILRKKSTERLGSKNYTEIIEHKFFEGVQTDVPAGGVYFETNFSLSEAHQKASSKRGFAKKADDNEDRYVAWEICGDINKRDQKNLLTFASLNWRKLVSPKLPAGPPKNDIRSVRDLTFLLSHQANEAEEFIPGYGRPHASIVGDSPRDSITIKTQNEETSGMRITTRKFRDRGSRCVLS